MSSLEKNVSCKSVAPLLVFYVCQEVSESERELIEGHLASCKACTEQLAEEKEFHSAFANAPQTADQLDASGILLSQCRSELEESLDDLSAPSLQEHWRPFGWLRRWMALRPAWSGALLVFLGVLAGTQLVPWLQNGSNSRTASQVTNVRAPQLLTPDQLSKMEFSGLNFSPSPGSDSPRVQLQLSAEQPLVLSGTVEDSNVRQVLTYVISNSERFDAGKRLDCMEVLKAVARDEEVRVALVSVARNDQNPAVRMKALESLRDAASNDDVRQVLLDTLQNDSNPGVRVEAVNLLVGSLNHEAPEAGTPAPDAPVLAPAAGASEEDASFDRVVRVLQQLQQRDPNRYVRLRSAAALRQIGPREVQ
ncbi:MAG TPA: HEAT repeat domain-containing protein [Candidatus Angelobacter sp.]|nr:HEAT repeat domain-containing protein [Candidatus Angelobacter sp.]